MSRSEESLLGALLALLFTLALCLLSAWIYEHRKSECMAKHNDELLCTFYAESIFH